MNLPDGVRQILEVRGGVDHNVAVVVFLRFRRHLQQDFDHVFVFQRFDRREQRIRERDVSVTAQIQVGPGRLHVAELAIGQCQLVVDHRR